MAKYGAPDLGITVKKGAAAAVDISESVDTINELNIEALIQDTTGFGQDWVENTAVGVKRGNPLTVEGFYDDATGSAASELDAVGETVEVTITWGGSNTSTFNAIITSYVKRPVKNELHRYACTLTPTGEVS